MCFGSWKKVESTEFNNSWQLSSSTSVNTLFLHPMLMLTVGRLRLLWFGVKSEGPADLPPKARADVPSKACLTL